jgi:hypothetical protein
VPAQPRSEAYSIPGKDTFIHSKACGKDALQYAKGVLYAIEGKLQEEIFCKGKHHQRDIGLEFRMICKTYDAATLHLVAFCTPDLEEPLRKIFELPVVVELQRSNLPEIPPLGFLIIPKPAKRVSKDIEIDVCGQKAFFARHSTYYGSPVILKASSASFQKGLARKSTFGGVIKVTHGNGNTSFYGMTAGHAAAEMAQDCVASVQEAAAKSFETLHGFGPLGWIADDDVLGRVLSDSQLPGVAAGRSRVTHD